ncbi:hypothetical protein BDFB_008241, partial [Asbolus verrucosus]
MGNSLPAKAEETANFLLFVDRLFDSVSGSLITTAGGSNCKDDDIEDCVKVFLLDNPEHDMHGVFAYSEDSVSE